MKIIETDESTPPAEACTRTETTFLPDGGVRITFFRPDGSEIGSKEMSQTEALIFYDQIDDAIEKWRRLN